MSTNLEELKNKYHELGQEIERLEREEDKVGYKDDPIFLFSVEEYEKYKNKIPDIPCWWWLRSPGGDYNYATGIFHDHYVCDGGNLVHTDNSAVRPALRTSDLIDIDALIGKDKIVFNGVTWINIDKDLYISELPIGFQRFDEKSNDYETSEVRKFLLDWIEDRHILNW